MTDAEPWPPDPEEVHLLQKAIERPFVRVEEVIPARDAGTAFPIEDWYRLVQQKAPLWCLMPSHYKARFSIEVRQRYGNACAMCGISVPELLEAAHLVPWSEGGADDARNGLPLCRNHHRALEAALVRIEPETGTFVARDQGPHLGMLGVTLSSLSHLPTQPQKGSLEWLWVRSEGQ